jgi:DNA-binding NtrC family response regulator
MFDMHGEGTDLTVLVVDDEDDLREVIRRILERKGFTALVAGDADEAIEVCHSHPGDIHVLLTDLSLPRVPGHELARQVVELRPGLRVVYVSGTSRDLAVAQGLIEEDATMLQKPFTADTLAAAVREAMAGTAA